MKRIGKIFWNDITIVVTNYSVFIVVAALCLLPSLYAWFNIKASWDPYSKSATRNIQIAVVNEDEGTILQKKKINIGQEVVTELKKNDQLGWQFVTGERAFQGLNEGEYFAMITIPSSFSSNLTSFIKSDMTKGEIIYTVNEKINAIAPKLTDKGATGLQEMISKTVVETVSDVVLGTAKEIGVNLEAQLPKLEGVYHTLSDFQGKFVEINQTLDLTEDGVDRLEKLISDLKKEIPTIERTITTAKGLAGDVKVFVEDTSQFGKQISPAIKQDLLLINNISSSAGEQIEALKTAIIQGGKEVPSLINQINAKMESLLKITKGTKKLLTALNKMEGNNKLSTTINQLSETEKQLTSVIHVLTEVKTQFETGKEIDLKKIDQIIAACHSVASVTNNLYNNYDSKIGGRIEQILKAASETAGEAEQILETAEKKLPDVSDLLVRAQKVSKKGKDGIAYVKTVIPKAEKTVNEITNQVKKVNDSDDLKELVDLLKVDVAKRSDFLANPVILKEEKLYPMGNYGTGMTPFYTVLSLWVGVLLLVSILSVNHSGNYQSYEVYFGKLLLFLLIGIIQAIIVALGDLYLLNIHCCNKLVFVLSNVMVSIVFVTIVYSLVSVFGNVGKVIAIILLVLQVAGSGGTFPVQLTPVFFQKINPFLPFTYGISMDREAIGGIVTYVYQKDVIVLIIYMIICIATSVFLKKPINQLLHRFVEKFEEGGLSS